MNLRDTLRQQRSTLSPATREQHSQQIFQNLLTLDALHLAQAIACYKMYDAEVDTTPIIDWVWEQKKSCYLPCVQPKFQLTFALYATETPLGKNHYHILEPISSDTINVNNLDVVILPVVAFNEQCERMGMGSGYYDHTFAFLNTPERSEKPLLIGLAYELQKTDNLFAKPWDVKLNYVVTENKVYRLR